MMNEMEWGVWRVEYNPQSEMYDVYCRKNGETRLHSSWCIRTTAEEVAAQMELHLARGKASLEAYFELQLDIKRVVKYDSLYALGRENALRTAH